MKLYFRHVNKNKSNQWFLIKILCVKALVCVSQKVSKIRISREKINDGGDGGQLQIYSKSFLSSNLVIRGWLVSFSSSIHSTSTDFILSL